MTDKILFQDNDNLSETNLTESDAKSNQTDYVVRGLGLSADFTADTVDVAAGYCIIETANNEAYHVYPDARNDVGLDSSTTNYVYVDIDPSTDDSISIFVDQSDTGPSGAGLKIGEVDTSADTATEVNRNPAIEAESLEGDLVSERIDDFEGSNLAVNNNTLDATDTNSQTDVSDDGTTVVTSTDDINFGGGLNASDDGDGSATIAAAASGGGYGTVTTVTSDYTASSGEVVLVDASGGPVSVTAPGVTEGNISTVKKIDSSSNAATIATPNSETIDGQSSIDITSQYAAREIAGNGTNYYII